MRAIALTLFIALSQQAALGAPGRFSLEKFSITRAQAERMAVRNSNLLKAYISDAEAATEQADAQFSALIPRLSLDGSYRYQTVIPNIPIPNLNIPLGSNSNYSVGPTLTYTLWDTFSARKSYHGFSRLADSREQSRKDAELQLLLQTRTAY